MKIRRVIGYAVAAVVVVAAGAAGRAWLTPGGAEPQPPVAGTPADLLATVARGEYLAKAADCIACHTSVGGTPYAGGRPFKLPFGQLYSTNITPDKETGIGNWSDDAFVRAVREGVGSHGNLYPAMPYTSYAEMSRDDVIAIKQYLMTLEPVHQAPLENDLSFPFNQRWGLAAWNAVFFRGQRFAPDPKQSVEWNRGAYLAGALGHCGECHTPRNVGFAMKSRDYLSGAEIEGWKAYNTTSDQAYGLGSWTDEQISQYLSRGHAPGRSSASGPMADVVEHSLQYLTPHDIASMVVYLRGVSPASGEQAGRIDLEPSAARASNAVLPGAASLPQALERGQRLFAGDCAGCHQWNGVGRQSEYASLVGAHAVNDPSGAALVQVLLHGTSLTVGGRTQQMPGFGAAYGDADIAAVANFVLSHFGSKQGGVTAEQVSKARAQ
ncbi:alcohol dehydrogenase [Burkholderia stabilis]|uniref:c-type cytochrome n=1 Tax=Burkholderia stabilis TaxID=95485 RepID=UPI00085191A7|nr:cytochrome c [Burkholderia stabilis]AOR72841.1 alcohol dehydrogenase [Burkholderia stabilis]HDR9492292.1 cytochrome c [Burkholderia stabilis]HDR9496440.1 cytochrome c [Burkholderia stabilis]HDR9522834.1 cytochrome c [Burkholderia stabilis]HDR9539904.1 cytochrome c [Burkholderia stabilis]